jgi:predicted MFS family arabinose efflux permease
VYGLLFLYAVSRAVTWPAGSALMPQLVPRAAFSNAVTWRSTAYQVASVTGPALGGLLIAICRQPGVAYAVTAALTLVNCLLVSRITVPAVSRSSEPASLESLLAGIGFVGRTKPVLAAITLDLFAVLLGGATALLPIYAKDILRVGPTGLGWLRAAPALGAFVMALVIAHQPPWRRPGRALLWAVAGFGLVMIGFGWSRWFWFSMVMLVLSGALDNISVVIRHSLVQLSTPDSMRGRVSAVNTVFISCSNELGEFESGFVAAWFGPVVSAVSGGIGTILVVLLVAKIWPQINRLRSLHETAAETTTAS